MSEESSGFGSWLRGKLVERRVSLAQLCRQAGCDYTYLWRIINSDTARGRRYTRPSYDLTRRVGEALESPREALAVAGYGEEGSLQAAREADRLLRLEKDLAHLREESDHLDAPQPAVWGRARLPLLGHIQAGDLNEALENPGEYADLPEWLSREADMALRVRGDSMSPTLLEGDIVAVRTQPVAAAGQLVVALNGDEATVKRYEVLEGVPTLVPDNPEWKPVRLGPRVRIVGVVTGSYRPPEVLLRRPR